MLQLWNSCMLSKLTVIFPDFVLDCKMVILFCESERCRQYSNERAWAGLGEEGWGETLKIWLFVCLTCACEAHVLHTLWLRLWQFKDYGILRLLNREEKPTFSLTLNWQTVIPCSYFRSIFFYTCTFSFPGSFEAISSAYSWMVGW